MGQIIHEVDNSRVKERDLAFIRLSFQSQNSWVVSFIFAGACKKRANILMNLFKLGLMITQFPPAGRI